MIMAHDAFRHYQVGIGMAYTHQVVVAYIIMAYIGMAYTVTA